MTISSTINEQNANYRPLIATSSSNIEDPLVAVKPGEYSGVVQYSNQVTSCTGTLLPTGRHILTVAHCLDNPSTPNAYTVSFELPSNRINIPVSRIIKHPDWSNFPGSQNDKFGNGNDMAILELAYPAPESVERYPIYRDSNEVGQVIQKVGYGVKGTGLQGEVTGTGGVKRTGLNRYDLQAESLNSLAFNPFPPGRILFYDFDNGNPVNDAFGRMLGIRDLGLGLSEVAPTQGDSGSPAFINGKIAGLTSFGEQPSSYGFLSVDVDDDNNARTTNDANSSFGEIFGETRVSAYANWINQTIIDTSSGDDQIQGTNRNDSLSGYRANDNITGLAGDDILLGAKGFDTISGGDGNDTIAGDRGQDILTGDGGNDVFVLSPIGGFTDRNMADVINDFTIGIDRIGLADGLTEANLKLEVAGITPDLEGDFGTLISDPSSGIFLAYVKNVTPEKLAGNFVPINLSNVSLI